VHVRVGDQINVSLDEKPSTGYRWEIEQADTTVLVPGARTYVQAQGTGVGGGGMMSLSFAARSPGTAAIRMKLWRPWEGEASVRARFAVTVVVQD
jgi:inhibitor of cysteine peptidase